MSQSKISAVKYINGTPKASHEALTQEEALQITLNGTPYTITMRTPGNDKFLVAGLLLSEGIIKVPGDIIELQEISNSEGLIWSAVVKIRKELLAEKNIFNRSIASSASCGVCGKKELCDIVAPSESILHSKKLDIHVIPKMIKSMNNLQSTFHETGGSHAAALFRLDGSILALQEDIGRHNAVDKVIGSLFLSNKLPMAELLFISGRVSYEIVVKCSKAKIPFLLAVSAPSSLAVDYCNKAGITLIAFCRDSRATVYNYPENIL
jgi:FdhD protein